MTSTEEKLWRAVETFSPDEPDAVLSFSQRLARENGWSADYTVRVVEEYKRFMFLCCVTSMSLTPSPAVDQAWHLHMVYTKSYWHDLCRNILKRELHHNPTQGGADEARKYRECYEQTLEQYSLKFGEEPPADIWPDADSRFAAENLQWVDLNRYILLPKLRPELVTPLKLFAGLVGGVIVVSVAAMWWSRIVSNSAVSIFLMLGVLVAGIAYWQQKTGASGGTGGDVGGGCSSCGNWFGTDSSSCSSDSSSCSSDGGCSSGCSGCGGGCSS